MLIHDAPLPPLPQRRSPIPAPTAVPHRMLVVVWEPILWFIPLIGCRLWIVFWINQWWRAVKENSQSNSGYHGDPQHWIKVCVHDFCTDVTHLMHLMVKQRVTTCSVWSWPWLQCVLVRRPNSSSISSCSWWFAPGHCGSMAQHHLLVKDDFVLFLWPLSSLFYYYLNVSLSHLCSS